MDLKIKNKEGKTNIDISVDGGYYAIVVDEEYDNNGNQHVPESVINTFGLPSPTLLNDEIKEELSHQKIIVDKK